MDLLKYLEPMKNIPERFSNLAFWRGVRKLKDEVVNAFEYVDSWGENIEHEISKIRKVDYSKTSMVNIKDSVTKVNFHVIEDTANDTVIIMFAPFDIVVNSLPDDYGAIVGVAFIASMDTRNGGSDNNVLIPCEIVKTQTGPSSFAYRLIVANTCCVAIDKYTERHWTKPYDLRVTRAFLIYHPTV
jgi:hypothetical protein